MIQVKAFISYPNSNLNLNANFHTGCIIQTCLSRNVVRQVNRKYEYCRVSQGTLQSYFRFTMKIYSDMIFYDIVSAKNRKVENLK